MNKTTYYLSNTENISLVLNKTELAEDELEHLVKRFKKNSSRAGQLRGKLVLYDCGKIEIRTSFGNKLLWRKE